MPFVQLVHKMSSSATMHETPLFLMCGRQSRLPVDIILSIPHKGSTADADVFARDIRDNLQLAFELTRRNLTEHVIRQAAENVKLTPYPVFKPGQKALVYRPFQNTDCPNPKL